MSDPDFPAFMPVVQRGAKFASNPRMLRSEMEDGHVRQIPIRQTELEQFSVKWLVNHIQVQVFRAWHKHVLFCGSAWFNINLPIADNESILAITRARMVNGVFTVGHLGGQEYVIEAILEVEDSPTPSADWLWLFDFSGGDFDTITPSFASFHDLLHVTMPLHYTEPLP